MKENLDKKVLKIEKYLLNKLRFKQKLVVSIFYILSAMIICFPVMYYSLFLYDFYNPESSLKFSFMLIGMIFGFFCYLFIRIAVRLEDEKIKL